jgi:hypothetical protein
MGITFIIIQLTCQAAVIYLQNKTLLILPHSEKLIGLLLPKLALTQRPTVDQAKATPVPRQPTSLYNMLAMLISCLVDPTPVTNVISNTKPLVGGLAQGFVTSSQINQNPAYQTGIPGQRVQQTPTPFRMAFNTVSLTILGPGTNFSQTNPTLLQQLQMQQQRNPQTNITNPHFPL